jgi:hypothetical protein
MSNKQSSVDWLIEEIKKNTNIRLRGFDIDKAIEKAKAMHKEESKVVFECGRNFQLTGENTFEEVYNETFEGGNK